MAGNQINDGRFEFEEEPTNVSSPIHSSSQEIAKGIFGHQFFTPEQVESARNQFKQKVVVPATQFTAGRLGFLGDIASLIHDYGVAPAIQAAVGGEKPSYEQLMFSKAFPTSEMLQKGAEELSGEKLRPETVGEKILAITAGFKGSLGAGGKMTSGKIFGKEISPGVKSFVSSFVPASVMVGAEEAGMPPGIAAGATVASSLLTHKLTNKSFKEINQELYKKVEDAASNVMLPSGPLERSLGQLSSKLSEGLTTAPKSRIRTMIDEISGKIAGGAYKLSDLIKWRRDINEVSKEFTGPQLKGSKNEWKSLRTAIDQTINDYSKSNPEWGQAYRQANSLYRGLNEAKFIENWIKKHPVISTAGAAGEYLTHAITHMLGGGISSAMTAKLGEFTVAMARNSGLRKEVANFFKMAAKEDVKGTVSSLNKVNKKLKDTGFAVDSNDRFEIEN